MSRKAKPSKRFAISSYVVIQLGEQLVSDEITAIVELVKNAYDADAQRVIIKVDTHSSYKDEKLATTNIGPAIQKGFILISDNGTGMDESDVTNGWLHISFSSKRGQNKEGIVTPKFGRSFLGSKGVGRLSAQRLGNRLDLFSYKSNYNLKSDSWSKAEAGVHVGINWRLFQESVDLEKVPVYYNDWMPRNNKSGSKLVITDLRDPSLWEEESSRSALVGTLAQLISPFEPAKDFRIDLFINKIAFNLIELTRGVRDTALSTYSFSFDGEYLVIKGKVKANLFRGGNKPSDLYDYQTLIAADSGEGFYDFLNTSKGINGLKRSSSGWYFEFEIPLHVNSLKLIEQTSLNKRDEDSKRVGEDDEVEETWEIVSPGPFHGEIDQLAYDNPEAENLTAIFNQMSQYKAYVKRHAGVRIYRNGFGIRPYGIDGDDWMGFQAGTTSGRSFYGLRPKNIIGYVSLTAEENGALEEKTDREGFVQNDAARNFFTLIYKVRDEINNVLNRVRRRYTEYKKATSQEMITSPDEVLSNMRATGRQVAELREQVSKTNLEVVEESISKKLHAIQNAPLLENINDINLHKLLDSTRLELRKAITVFKELNAVHDKLKHLEPTAAFLESRLEQLSNQISDFTELAGVGLTAEALTHEISNIVDRLLEETEHTAIRVRAKNAPLQNFTLYIEKVRSALLALRKQTQHLDPSLRYVREKKEIIKLSSHISELKSFYESRLRFQQVGITINVETEIDFEVFCSGGKLTQIFDNIFINSEYWLGEATRKKSISNPNIHVSIKNPFVEIYDNGFGIDPGIVSHLFQPFVTTKPRNMGRGLGLFITSQLLESMACNIRLLPDLNRYNRPYIFQLDLAGVLYE